MTLQEFSERTRLTPTPEEYKQIEDIPSDFLFGMKIENILRTTSGNQHWREISPSSRGHRYQMPSFRIPLSSPFYFKYTLYHSFIGNLTLLSLTSLPVLFFHNSTPFLIYTTHLSQKVFSFFSKVDCSLPFYCKVHLRLSV